MFPALQCEMIHSASSRLPIALLLAGHAGTGKTRFSKQVMTKAMVREKSLVFLDKDTIGGTFSHALMQLHTGDANDRDSEAFQTHVRPLEYQALLDVALENLAMGVDCILCAPFGRECKTYETYGTFVETTFKGKALPLLVWAHVDPVEAKARIERRGHPMDAYKLRHWDAYIARRYRPEWVHHHSHGAQWLESGVNNEDVLRWVEAQLGM